VVSTSMCSTIVTLDVPLGSAPAGTHDRDTPEVHQGHHKQARKLEVGPPALTPALLPALAPVIVPCTPPCIGGAVWALHHL